LKYIIPIIIISLFLIGCKKDDDDSSSNTEIEGTWKTPCYASGSAYRLKSLVVTGTTFVDTTNIYSDSSCTSENSKWVDAYSSLSIGDAISWSSGGSGHKFTLTADSFTATPLKADTVTTLNTYSYCGDSDWALNTEKDISGKTCTHGTEWAAGTAVQGVYKLDGSNLYWAVDSSYPSTVAEGDNDTYTKQ